VLLKNKGNLFIVSMMQWEKCRFYNKEESFEE